MSEPWIESDTGPWAAVPAWIIDADISTRALKLYCVLSLYADGGANGDGGTTRSRVGVAARLSCSVDTLDRAANELEKIGAIERIARFDELGDRAPNRWKLYRTRPGQRSSAATGQRENAAVRTTRPPTDPDPQERVAAPKAFDQFWTAYPRKEAKGDARKAWTAAVKKAPVSAIIAGALRYRDDPNREDPYTKTPGPWLRAERWADDPLPCRPDARRNGHSEPADLRETPTTPDDPDYAEKFRLESEAWRDAHDPTWREREAKP